MQGTQVWSLGREDPLEEEMAPTPVFPPGKSHGQDAHGGYGPWGRKGSDIPWRRRWHPLQDSRPGNPMDKMNAAAVVHGVGKGQTELSS